jgi:hypothetical protein
MWLYHRIQQLIIHTYHICDYNHRIQIANYPYILYVNGILPHPNSHYPYILYMWLYYRIQIEALSIHTMYKDYNHRTKCQLSIHTICDYITASNSQLSIHTIYVDHIIRIQIANYPYIPYMWLYHRIQHNYPYILYMTISPHPNSQLSTYYICDHIISNPNCHATIHIYQLWLYLQRIQIANYPYIPGIWPIFIIEIATIHTYHIYEPISPHPNSHYPYILYMTISPHPK